MATRIWLRGDREAVHAPKPKHEAQGGQGRWRRVALTEKGYMPRLADQAVERCLRLFGAVSIEGPKWCGKTWTALNHANSAVYLLDPENGYQNREAARLNPASILVGERPLLVDEWQEVPGIWDAVRFASDRAEGKGSFILTGSVTPKEQGHAHSGAGRIARVRMGPMTLFESDPPAAAPRASIMGMFEAGGALAPGASSLNQERLIQRIVRGGWPASLSAPAGDAAFLVEQYVGALVETDITHADSAKRDPALARHLLASVARVNATAAKDSVIVADVQARFGNVSRQNVAGYLSTLRRLHVVVEIPQWFPALRDKLRLRAAPKRMLADPSIAARALQATPQGLARDPRTLGGLFENLCLRDLLAYAEAVGARLSHYRDASGLEADAVLELGGAWAALEIKLGAHRVDEGAASLKRLEEKLVARGAPRPAFKAVVVGGGPMHTREDGVHVIPVDCLAP
jgi:predicted AAA+ superfamily ATPase